MFRDDTRGRGGAAAPFEHYPAPPAAVSNQADALLASAVRMGRIGDQAYARERQAIVATDGELSALLDTRLADLRNRTVELKSAAVVASGALTIWADAIANYNSGVDRLNEQYALARDGSGVGRLLVIATLRAQLAALEADLDETAGRVGHVLDCGPSESAVLRLFQHGTLPLSVASLLSEYDFSGIDTVDLVRGLGRHGDLAHGLDPKQIAAAVRLLQRLSDPDSLAWSWSRAGLTMAWEELSELDPRAVDLVVLGLSDDQLTQLDRLVSTTSTGDRLPGVESGLDRFDLADFHTLFLANASATTLRRLQRCWPSINPTIKNVDDVEHGPIDRPHWGKADGDRLYDAVPSADDIDQGAVGDCWMEAKLAALAQDDPGWVADHVRHNANGTMTVTFYDDDGDTHEVTVTSQLPVDDYGNRIYSGDGDDGAGWSDYYEKAFALISDNHHDGESGYGGIEYGTVSREADLMTGYDTDDINDDGGLLGINDHKDLDDIRDHVEDGDAVVVGTVGGRLDLPYVPHHAYYVKGFDTEGAIVLGNPWSDDYDPLTLSEDKFNSLIDDAAVINHD